MRLFLPFVPPSANRIWRTGRGVTFLSSEAQKYYREAQARWTERVPDDWKACSVRIYVVPVRRGIDVDNRLKPVLDALTRAGVWVDDDVVAEVFIKLARPNKRLLPNGGTFVEILPVEEKYSECKEIGDW